MNINKLQNKGKTTFGNDSAIEWTNKTWNPVTGCLHGCKYCYAREVSQQTKMKAFYPFEFEPTIQQRMLDAPYNQKNVKQDKNRVFVSSMGDLFGKWVPTDVIEQIFTICSDNPQWNYLFLTKNPARYLTLDFPKTAWIGATGDTQIRMNRALSTFNELAQNGKKTPVTFISCEPLSEPIIMNEQHLKSLDWLIIGGQTKNRALINSPEKDWVFNLVKQAKQYEIPVFFKDNVTKDSWKKDFKEYPKILVSTTKPVKQTMLF